MNVVIKVENLSKQYRLGLVGTGTLSHDLNRWWAKIRGKEDPFLKVGEVNVQDEKGIGEYVWALKDINFEVKQGEVLGIIGKNGAGKSTLLKILSRVTGPTMGSVKTRGRIASLLEIGTGFHPELTGRENIFLNGAILGMTKLEIKSKFDEIVDFSGVERYIDTPVKRYSSGMHVRLGFAVAAHLEPEILIIDEVLAVGDAEFQKKCLGKMKDVAGEGRTVLFVSHNMSAIKQLCPRSILLEEGSIIKEENSIDVVNFYLTKDQKPGKPTQEFISDKNKQVQIRRVSVCDHEGNPAKTVDLNHEIIIQIDYELKERMSNMSVGVSIFINGENKPLISLNDAELEASQLKQRQVGYYKSVVVIPPKILNTGTYRIRVGSTCLHVILDVVDNIIFTVIDNVGIFQILGYERKNSLLSLQLPWETTYLKPQLK